MNRRTNTEASLFVLPSLIGFCTFYLIPFVFSLKYSVTDRVINGRFIGLHNFYTILSSDPFLRAIKNTALFMGIGIPLNIVTALIMGSILSRLSLKKRYATVFMMPMVIPSACIAFLFQSFCSSNGLLSRLLLVQTDWLQTQHSLIIAVILYVWKNMGYNLVLIMAGLSNIPTEYYEWASVEGMGRIKYFFKITLIYLMPTLFVVLVMSFINGFKVFREIYMLAGNYPNEKLYMLQHYMNNQFLSLNYQNLTTACIIVTAVISIFVSLFYSTEHRLELGE